MKAGQAQIAFAALSQETRLRIVRMLVKAGPEGMAAGSLAEAAGVSASNVSFHLKDLEHAGLINARRDARSIIYSADYKALRGLIEFLMKDCCAGHPDICVPALADVCCPPPPAKRKRAHA
ncbi:MAG: metalloregulator ArsR/SmtB family transcription factor [Pseudolabrys sp.]|nr:metalloregulator ArsR/SmtB family transcription factor [Pseudolabrys sp.]